MKKLWLAVEARNNSKTESFICRKGKLRDRKQWRRGWGDMEILDALEKKNTSKNENRKKEEKEGENIINWLKYWKRSKKKVRNCPKKSEEDKETRRDA